MLLVTGLIIIAMTGFALSPLLFLTLGLYLAIDILRSLRDPLNAAWVNQKLDPQTRATIHSMTGQVDAVGQMAGGPSVALVAKSLSVAAAITTSALLLAPAMFLVNRANSQPEKEASVVEESPTEV